MLPEGKQAEYSLNGFRKTDVSTVRNRSLGCNLWLVTWSCLRPCVYFQPMRLLKFQIGVNWLRKYFCEVGSWLLIVASFLVSKNGSQLGTSSDLFLVLGHFLKSAKPQISEMNVQLNLQVRKQKKSCDHFCSKLSLSNPEQSTTAWRMLSHDCDHVFLHFSLKLVAEKLLFINGNWMINCRRWLQACSYYLAFRWFIHMGTPTAGLWRHDVAFNYIALHYYYIT